MDRLVENHPSSSSYFRYELQDALAAQLTAISLSPTPAALQFWLHTAFTEKLSVCITSCAICIKVSVFLIKRLHLTAILEAEVVTVSFSDGDTSGLAMANIVQGYNDIDQMSDANTTDSTFDAQTLILALILTRMAWVQS